MLRILFGGIFSSIKIQVANYSQILRGELLLTAQALPGLNEIA